MKSLDTMTQTSDKIFVSSKNIKDETCTITYPQC